MKPKPVIPRALAARDIEEAVAYYLHENAPQAALDFIDAVETSFLRLGRHPGAGSPRIGHELDLPGLRSFELPRFPFSVYYVESPDHIDVWRVLHGKRDLPVWLQVHDGPR